LDPEQSRAICAALVEVLEQNPPPKDTVAYDPYRLNLVVQRWMLSRKSRKRRRELRESLQNISEQQRVQDYTLLRFLGSGSASSLSLVLPQRLRKMFYRHGVPVFGVKAGIRAVVIALIITAVFLFIPTPRPGEWTDPVTGMEFVWVPGGCFEMGGPEWLTKPVHEVCMDGFWMGKYEVTQGEWEQILGENPSAFQSERVGTDSRNHPVERVSWDDVQEFVHRLNEQSETTVFRLPSEAEWEYACRAGTQTIYNLGDDPGNLREYAWYDENSELQTHPVGQLKPMAVT
jgi:formylglycine-generating enzyme required for sulfatase activity